MKRSLSAILLLLLGSGAWGQSQPGVGLSISPVPGSGSNAGASTLRMDLGGSNPSAPASSSLGLALSPSLSLSPKVSPAAPAAPAAAPAAGLSAKETVGPAYQQGVPTPDITRTRPARVENSLRAAPFDPASRTAPARNQGSGLLSVPDRSLAAFSRAQDLSAARTARGEDRKASAVLQDLAASPLEHSRAFDGDIHRPQTGVDASIVGNEAAPSPRTDSLLKPHSAAADAGRIDTPSPDPLADPEPFKLPLWKRALAVTGILGFLAAAPSLLNAAALQTVGQAVLPSFSAGSVLSIFTQNAALLLSPWAWGVAGALALIGLPLRIFVFRLSPWSMHWLKDPGNGLAKKPLWMLLPLLAVAAASEELTFRAMAFGLSFVFLSTLMAAPLALAAASFLSSLVFALIHGYGPVWTRVVGGMLYSAAFAVTGSLLFITLAHMLFNLRALSLARRSNGQ